MNRIIIPENVNEVMRRLAASGYEAYAVGGAVRDSILGRKPNDWDVTTSALPDAVISIFEKESVPTGLKHGTVTVISGQMNIEVTTFRTDGKYTDHRRPDTVKFTSSVIDDLSRRDFTMNAIALDSSGTITDPFSGLNDIISGIIRCVGDPETRFEEDALRMFRAIRFSCQLGFSIDDGTYGAILRKSYLASELAVERIKDELEKAIMSEHTAGVSQMFTLGLMRRFSDADYKLPGFEALNSLPLEKTLRWAGLCALLEKSGVALTWEFLSGLKCDSKTINNCSQGVSAVLSGFSGSGIEWKSLFASYGDLCCRCAAASMAVLGVSDSFEKLDAVLSSGECRSIDMLAVNGRDIAAMGYTGKDIGKVLKALLEHVIKVPEDNIKEKLLTLVK